MKGGGREGGKGGGREGGREGKGGREGGREGGWGGTKGMHTNSVFTNTHQLQDSNRHTCTTVYHTTRRQGSRVTITK